MSIQEKLMNIQAELKAPKGQFNSFGKYKYRSCEDILEAVKPLLNKHKCVLTVGDDIIGIDNRFYIKATAVLADTESTDTITNAAFAREDESKKGMDGSQITGAASSYARKYALNGLFAIDDTKDADTDENYNQQENKPTKNDINYPTDNHIKALITLANQKGVTEAQLKKKYNCSDLHKLPMKFYTECIKGLENMGDVSTT